MDELLQQIVKSGCTSRGPKKKNPLHFSPTFSPPNYYLSFYLIAKLHDLGSIYDFLLGLYYLLLYMQDKSLMTSSSSSISYDGCCYVLCHTVFVGFFLSLPLGQVPIRKSQTSSFTNKYQLTLKQINLDISLCLSFFLFSIVS
jgi:hypothetical protein